MIPKILHFVWLSGSELPADIQACLDSWKEHLSGYEIKYWTDADVENLKNDYVTEAIKVKKWAFASDYIRLYALYHFGGIYMDSDVLVRRNFDFVLENRFFSAIESYPEDIDKSVQRGVIDLEGNKLKDVPFVLGIQIQAAIMGSEKGHPFLKGCMEYYDNHVFLDSEGKPSMDMISPYIYANAAVKYGFKFKNEPQELLEGIKLYPASMFAPSTCQVLPESYAIHCCKGSWREHPDNSQFKYTENTPSLSLVKQRLDGIIKATQVMKAYSAWPDCNDFIMQRFFNYLSNYSLWEYRFYLLKLFLTCGIQTANKIHDGVCFHRGVHANLYCRLKQWLINVK